MTGKEKLIYFCPDPGAKRRLVALFGLEKSYNLTWCGPSKGPLFERGANEEKTGHQACGSAQAR